MYKNRALKIMWLSVIPLTIALHLKIQTGCLGTADTWCVTQVLAILGAGGDDLLCFGFSVK